MLMQTNKASESRGVGLIGDLLGPLVMTFLDSPSSPYTT